MCQFSRLDHESTDKHNLHLLYFMWYSEKVIGFFSCLQKTPFLSCCKLGCLIQCFTESTDEYFYGLQNIGIRNQYQNLNVAIAWNATMNINFKVWLHFMAWRYWAFMNVFIIECITHMGEWFAIISYAILKLCIFYLSTSCYKEYI